MVLEYHLKIWKELVLDILPTNFIVWTNLALFMDSEARLWLTLGIFHHYFKLHPEELSQIKHLSVFLLKANENLSKKLVNHEKLMVQQWLSMIFSTIFLSGRTSYNCFYLYYLHNQRQNFKQINFILQKKILQFNFRNWRY